MPDVVTSYGPCEAERCKRPDRTITEEDDIVRIRGKQYHRGCEPTEEELRARDNSYT